MPDKNFYKLVSNNSKDKHTEIKVGSSVIGGKFFTVMAGPCAVENKKQVEDIASIVKNTGAIVLRGGAFKPRTSPYSFQGLEEEGLKYLREAADRNNMIVVSEIMDIRNISLFLKYVDIIQVGARNSQNFNLLKELGKINKPILLKRGLGMTIDELLWSAEHILFGGNKEVILCERGIRTFESATRSTLDISAVPIIKKLSHLPVIVDPSHAAGERTIIPFLAKAALAVGADGLIVEVHNDHENALCDGPQALLPEQFEELMDDLKKIAPTVGKKM